MTFEANYGFNNEIIAVAKAAWYGLETNQTLVFPRKVDWMLTRFDLRFLFSAFGFVVEEDIPPNGTMTRFTQNMFYRHIRNIDRNRWFNFRAAFLGLVFCCPTKFLAESVERVKREVLGGMQYVGLHVRNINPSSMRWEGRIRALYRNEFQKGPAMVRLNGPRGNSTWDMSPEYVANQLAVHGLSNATVFLGHDRQSHDMVERLMGAAQLKVVQATPVSYPELLGDMDSLLVDMLVLMDSSLFIGNEGSTVPWNIISLRRARGQLWDNILGPDH